MLAVGRPLTGESPRADVSSVAHGFTVHGFGQHHTLAPGAQLLKDDSEPVTGSGHCTRHCRLPSQNRLS